MPASPSVIVVYGPTAGGKSSLAAIVAERLDGVVINADSLQLYADLEILTARPESDLLDQAPHRLYGVLPAGQAGSAAWWRAAALAEIQAAHAAGRTPIVTGGTGLYLKALMEGLSPLPVADMAARERATALYTELGGEAFRAELAGRDPASAARLNPGDRQRLIRAWEVLESTGIPLSAWQARPLEPGHDLSFRTIGVVPPRDILYERIDRRFAAMLDRGALDEAARFAALGLPLTLPANKALGLPELRRHLSGEIGIDEAVSRAQQASRNYAKRQMTWFRHQMPSVGTGRTKTADNLTISELSESTIAEIIAFIVRNG